jgi:hypothetical protein
LQERKKIDFVKQEHDTFTSDEVEKLMEWAFNASRATTKVQGRDRSGFQRVSVCKYNDFQSFCVMAMNRIYSNH